MLVAVACVYMYVCIYYLCVYVLMCVCVCVCVHHSASFLETYDVLRRENPTIWAWGKDVKPRIWVRGVSRQEPTKGTLRPKFSLRDRNFQQFCLDD